MDTRDERRSTRRDAAASGDEERDRLSRREAVTRLGVGALGVAGAGVGYRWLRDGGTSGEPAATASSTAGATSAGGASPAATRPDSVPSPDATLAEAAAALGIPAAARVAAEPTRFPGPITRRRATTVRETITIREAAAEIEPGVHFGFMTFDGQVPGRMIRVRQGDEVRLRLENPASNRRLHNVDLHAVFGPGGGAAVTDAAPTQANEFVFQARYPGAFVYHCAISTLDHHISSGMYGLIVVEPPEGLPEVDREFYVGQHEVYSDTPAGTKGVHRVSLDRMKREDPTYVLLNGEKYALTPDRRGPMEARVGETARIFFANGGPNLTSSFHPIGNVFSRLWREGAVMSRPERYVQTVSVPPGSALVAEMEFPVPGPVKLVDHALTRVARKGMLGVIDVKGAERPDVFSNGPGPVPLSG